MVVILATGQPSHTIPLNRAWWSEAVFLEGTSSEVRVNPGENLLMIVEPGGSMAQFSLESDGCPRLQAEMWDYYSFGPLHHLPIVQKIQDFYRGDGVDELKGFLRTLHSGRAKGPVDPDS
jgi:hypothetical protein